MCRCHFLSLFLTNGKKQLVNNKLIVAKWDACKREPDSSKTGLVVPSKIGKR